MSKRKWPHAEATEVAEKIVAALEPACESIIIAGSLRRRKPLVGDVEIVFVPKIFAGRATDLFAAPSNESCADVILGDMLKTGLLAKRQNVKGSQMWGPQNKLAVHVPTGIPVDLFVTNAESWWNYLVCRTGGAESNIAIAAAAKRRGWKWNPYGSGFSRGGPLAGEEEIHLVTSERDVFEFAGLRYLEPEQRV